ncbi:Primary amine oxidase [Morus notabilis]|uniref:Amine oxidase n=1 Tax=Morus notabilis TaxID=981085 RepID=W9S6I2_9ROSA|nr:Primary amine oxidase [Morus notabilis]
MTPRNKRTRLAHEGTSQAMEESVSHNGTLNTDTMRKESSPQRFLLSGFNQLQELLDKDTVPGPANDETSQKDSAFGATLKPLKPTNFGLLAILEQHAHGIGKYARDCDFRHRKFSKSLTDRAYTCHQLHPLDPLTPSEVDQVRTIVTTFEPNSSFHYVGLDEPDKPTVLSWIAGSPSPSPSQPRRAFVVTRVNQTTHEIVIDLSNDFVVSDRVYEGHGFPMLTFDEQTTAINLVRKYSPFVAAVKKRGWEFYSGGGTDKGLVGKRGWFGLCATLLRIRSTFTRGPWRG